jgi:hypothetical protein
MAQPCPGLVLNGSPSTKPADEGKDPAVPALGAEPNLSSEGLLVAARRRIAVIA